MLETEERLLLQEPLWLRLALLLALHLLRAPQALLEALEALLEAILEVAEIYQPQIGRAVPKSNAVRVSVPA
jgi:hypothetical protein